MLRRGRRGAAPPRAAEAIVHRIVRIALNLGFAASILAASFGAAPTLRAADPSDDDSPPPPEVTAVPSPAPLASTVYHAKSPEYGMNVFVWGNPKTTDRDLN